jgi:adenylate kinase family enzyme
MDHDLVQTAQKYHDKQIPMPAPSVVAMLKSKIDDEVGKGETRFLIDGFPRTEESAREFRNSVGPLWYLNYYIEA